MPTRKLEVEITGDARSFQKAVGKAQTSNKSFGLSLGGVAKGGALAAGAAGVGGLIFTLKNGYREWQDSTRVAAQTGAVIKSTGGSAHVTAKQVDDLSGALMKKSGVDDEVIKSGENMLLTFTNIHNEAGRGNDIFDQATKATLDLSVATGKDMTNSSVLLGKALNDPVAGLSALKRVGVSFTAAQVAMIKSLQGGAGALGNLDVIGIKLTKTQKEQAKGMNDLSDTTKVASELGIHLTDAQKAQVKSFDDGTGRMAAQKVVLGELNKEFGGSAEAIGKTLPGQIDILKERFNNFSGELVAKMVPTMVRLTTWLNKELPVASAKAHQVIDAMSAWWAEHGKQVLRVLSEIVTQVRLSLAAIQAIFKTFSDVMHGNWSSLWGDLRKIVMINFTATKNIIDGVSDGIHGSVHGLAVKIRGDIGDIVGYFVGLPARLLKTLPSLSSVMSAMGHAMAAALKFPINAAIKLIDSISIPPVHFQIPGIKVAGHTIVPDINFGWDGSGALFNIPQLNTGGMVEKTGLAVVHQGEEWLGTGSHRRPAGGSAGGDTYVTVVVEGSVTTEGKLIDKIKAGLVRDAARNGRSLYAS